MWPQVHAKWVRDQHDRESRGLIARFERVCPCGCGLTEAEARDAEV